MNTTEAYQYKNGFEWHPIFLKFEQDQPLKLTIYADDLTSCWGNFRSQFVELRAAGGLVLNEKHLLFIFRNGKWDLPKGKMETGEGVEETALREVQEECGINKLTLKKHLINTYHIYPFDKGWIFKQTDWFLMSSNQKKGLVPQIDEGIELVKWISPEKLDYCLKNSYETIANVIQSYFLSNEIASGKN